MPAPFCEKVFLPPGNPDDVCAVMRRTLQLHELMRAYLGYTVDCDNGNLPTKEFALDLGAMIVPPGTVWQYFPKTNNYDALKAEVESVWGPPNSVGLPWWQLVPEMEGRVPLGADKDHQPNSIGGKLKVKLDVTEMPEHVHEPIFLGNTEAQVDHVEMLSGDGFAVVGPIVPGRPIGIAKITNSSAGKTGGGLEHENMPPYRAIVWMRRTTRMQV